MDKPQILVTIPTGGPAFASFFDDALRAELEAIAPVEWNESDAQFTPEQMAKRLRGKTIAVTGWGTPILDDTVLAGADALRLVAHTGGSVRPYVTDEAFARGIRACSGNRVFAQSVAEGVIAYMLASLRRIPHYATDLQRGVWPPAIENKGLLGCTVGLVGFGMVAECLAEMLAVFQTPLKVFSHHVGPDTLAKLHMQTAGLAEIFSTCDIVSLHCGLTTENYHLVTEALLDSMKPGALLVNTARGPVVDEAALARVLRRRPDLSAALDVYEQEPLEADSPLLCCTNTLLMPHMAGPTIDRRKAVTAFVLEDIRRFWAGEALGCEISAFYASKMTTTLPK